MALDQPRGRTFWLIYSVLAISAFAVVNAITPYEPGVPNEANVLLVLLLVLLCLPLVVFSRFPNWHLADFGLQLNPLSLAIAVLIGAVCSSAIGYKDGFQLFDGIVEAALRSGEEVFFRGFVFSLVLVFAGKRKYAWAWATFMSALLFAAAHTSAFRQEYLSTGGTTAPWLFVTERLLNVLLVGIVMGLMRAGTGSIIPAIVSHSIAGGGVIALPSVAALLIVLFLWSIARREHFWSFSIGAPGLAQRDLHP